jgi:hypothetical protein
MAVNGLSTGQTVVSDEATAPSDPETTVRSGDRPARLFVWASWVVMVASTFAVVLLNARNVPIYEDWQVVPAYTGHQDHFWTWLWAQNNEHRVPLPKLIYLGLLKLWPDFRVGMVFSIVLLAVVAAAFVIFMRRLWGHTRWTDAFFPVVLLHLGHWENLGWSWQLQFVVATALACGVLMGSASPRAFGTRRALALGACLVAIPFTGATALPFAPLVALGLLPRLRQAPSRPRAVLASSIVVTFVVTLLYFVGLQHPSWVPPSPSPWATIETGLKSLALSFGPAASAWWFVSALAAVCVVAGAAILLLRARGRELWALLAFLAGGGVLALEIGNGRAGYIPIQGLADRYALIAVPVLCCAYLVYDRYGNPTWRRLAPGVLCGTVIALLPLNVIFGFQFRDWYHRLVDPFAAEVKTGVPLDELTYYGVIAADIPTMSDVMVQMHQAGIGVFSKLQERGTPGAGLEIDGLGSGANGWYTLGGASSEGVVQDSGAQTVLRWDYDPGANTVPVLGRSFATPQDWRGAGAIAITLVGQGDGRVIDVRIATASGSGGVDRYDASFVDDQPGSRTVVIPWEKFQHVDTKGEFDLQGPLPRGRVVAVALGATGPARGSLVIQRMALEPGHSEIAWETLARMTTRESLPPWR